MSTQLASAMLAIIFAAVMLVAGQLFIKSRAETAFRLQAAQALPSQIPFTGFRQSTTGPVLTRQSTFLAMRLTHKFALLAPERRPQDPQLDGSGLRFETMDHGGEYPDTMPQAIKLTDADGRSCVYVPITQNGRVVDSEGHTVDAGDED